MFTGLVQNIGKITIYEKGASDLVVGIKTALDTSEIKIGASIACSGCCLTVTKIEDEVLFFEVSNETLSCTVLGEWKEGSSVNLEKSLRVGDELGGHFVLGHVDCVTKVLEITPDDASHRITFENPANLKHLIATKGSITIDGVSLTVNEVTEESFTVNIIPHTWEQTTLGQLKTASKVNLEIDLLARYMNRVLESKGQE